MFQFTHPGKGATVVPKALCLVTLVSIHAPWEGCDFKFSTTKGGHIVSIHAPWEGCDRLVMPLLMLICSFNSRTLGRVRQAGNAAVNAYMQFQFTHPGKGATPHFPFLGRTSNLFQFTHPGKGATDVLTRWLNKQTFQFTHPGKGATSLLLISRFSASRFNSRTLGRVRPQEEGHRRTDRGVSIHAPWEGCDGLKRPQRGQRRSFNSRTLGRVRPVSTCTQGRATQFQFTHPGKGATTSHQRRLEWSCVSIHAPWEGCDTESKVTFASPLRFQFTHPGKGATPTCPSRPSPLRVSIHAPWEGCDW